MIAGIFNDGKKLPFVLAILFLASVAFRLPYLDRPLSSRHEWLTSTSLIHIQAFYEQGFNALHFSPSLTYGSPADKNIGFHWNLRDSSGNIYYCSFPPFAFIFPAVFFKAVHLFPTVLGLQAFNLFFHFISCVFVYLILVILTGRKKTWPAVLGFLVYLFSPSPMWFQSNVYMSDMFVQPFFIMGIWLFLKATGGQKTKWPFEVLFALDLFAFVYTEWMGVFFAMTAFVLLILRARELGAVRVVRLLAIVSIATAAPLALTVWQYSLISGFPDLLDYLKGKFLFRTGDPRFASGGQSFLNIVSWLNILVNYIGGFLPFLALAIVLAVKNKKLSAPHRTDKFRFAALALALAPVILHHAIFFNFTTVHDFSALKGGVFIAIITALLYDNVRLKSNGSGSPKKKEILVLAGTIVFSLLIYYLVDGYGAHGRYKKIGETVRMNAGTNEVVFVNGLGSAPEPQYLVYAQRDLEPWGGLEQAKALIKKNGVSQGILFDWSADTAELKSMTRFSLTNRTVPIK